MGDEEKSRKVYGTFCGSDGSCCAGVLGNFNSLLHGTWWEVLGEVGGSATVCNNGKIVCLVVDAGSSTREPLVADADGGVGEWELLCWNGEIKHLVVDAGSARAIGGKWQMVVWESRSCFAGVV